MRNEETLTHERLLDLLRYHPATGLLTWRQTRSRHAKLGDEAGTINKAGVAIVGIDRKVYTAARLIWFYQTKTWPPCRVKFLDGDSENLRFENLALELDPNKSFDSRAVKHRKWRAARRAAHKFIQTDPILSQRLANATSRYYTYKLDGREAAARNEMRSIKNIWAEAKHLSRASKTVQLKLLSTSTPGQTP